MNTKRENFLRSLRTPSGTVQAAGAVFWLAILITSLVRQLMQQPPEEIAANTDERSTAAFADYDDEGGR
jgi:hypothetical protein